MIISDLHTPFENCDETSTSTHDWHQDRARYTDQQIGEMPTWIKIKKEQASDITHGNYEVVDINSFSEMQDLAYNIIKNHSEDTCVDKDSLCLIIIGVAGTGKATSLMLHATFCKIDVLSLQQQAKHRTILKVSQFIPC
jgi:hypothetical protein